jgi:hypothetical protein
MIDYKNITACMVHYNRPYILSCTLPTWKEFDKIFVWDNNSVAQNKVFLKSYAAKNSNVTPIWHHENVGWPKAINRMIVKSDTDWVLVTADDMCLGTKFLETLNKLIEWKPNLEQIYLHTFDAMLFHKRTIARFGWWDEGQPNVAPFWEDNDWYLRLVEFLGYSPYVYPGEHIQGEERKRRLKFASTTELMERMDNISYFSNCRWGISSVNFDIKEITRDTSYVSKYNKNVGESAESYYLRKWQETGDEKDILNKDGTFWKRLTSDKEFYPDVRNVYVEKYL